MTRPGRLASLQPALSTSIVLLLAISPLLVYQSKTARPYALTSLLAFIAIVAFRRWWQRDGSSPALAAAYAAATFFAAWLHPVTLPFTLLPFAYYGTRSLLAASERPSARSSLIRLLGLGGVTAVMLAAALAPPLTN